MIWACILFTIFLVITIYVVLVDFAGKTLVIIAIIFFCNFFNDCGVKKSI